MFLEQQENVSDNIGCTQPEPETRMPRWLDQARTENQQAQGMAVAVLNKTGKNYRLINSFVPSSWKI
jgi:pyridoxine/pyridoxamine 5'-phosphate oxidase